MIAERIIPASQVPTPPPGFQTLFLDASNSNKLTVKSSDGSTDVIGSGSSGTIQVPCISGLTNADAGRLMVWNGIAAQKSQKSGEIQGQYMRIEFDVINSFVPPIPAEWELQFSSIPNDGDAINLRDDVGGNLLITAKNTPSNSDEYAIGVDLATTMSNLYNCLNNHPAKRVSAINATANSVFVRCDILKMQTGSWANIANAVFASTPASCTPVIWLAGADNSYLGIYTEFLQITGFYNGQVICSGSNIINASNNTGIGLEQNGYRFPTTQQEYVDFLKTAIEIGIAPHNTPIVRFSVSIDPNNSNKVVLTSSAFPQSNDYSINLYSWVLPNVNSYIASYGSPNIPAMCYDQVLGLLVNVNGSIATIDTQMVAKDFILEAGAKTINFTTPPPSSPLERIYRTVLLPSDNGTLMTLSDLFDWENGEQPPQLFFLLSLTNYNFIAMQESPTEPNERNVKAMVSYQMFLGNIGN